MAYKTLPNLSQDLIFFKPFFKNSYPLIFEREDGKNGRKEGGRGEGMVGRREICCSTHPCIHWFPLKIKPQLKIKHNPGILGWCSNQLKLGPGAHILMEPCTYIWNKFGHFPPVNLSYVNLIIRPARTYKGRRKFIFSFLTDASTSQEMPRIACSYQKLVKSHGTDSLSKPPEVTHSDDIMTWDFWPPKLWQNQFLLFLNHSVCGNLLG